MSHTNWPFLFVGEWHSITCNSQQYRRHTVCTIIFGGCHNIFNIPLYMSSLPAVSMHVSVCICRCMHVRVHMWFHARVCVCIQYLTCGVGPLSGTSPAVLGANAPSLQQSLEGAVLPWWGNTAEPLGTAQGVHTTGLSLGQHWRAAGNIMVPGGPTCPQWIPAGGTDLEGAQAVCPGPWSAVSNQQQNNGC